MKLSREKDTHLVPPASLAPTPGDGGQPYYGSARLSTYQDTAALIISNDRGEDTGTVTLNRNAISSIVTDCALGEGIGVSTLFNEDTICTIVADGGGAHKTGR